MDSAGNLFIRTSSGLIRKVSNGIISTVAGACGKYGFSGDNGPAANAVLSGGGGIAVDSSGNLYIADDGNNRVRKISNGVITTVAGNGTFGLSGADGPATSVPLPGPTSVAADSAGDVYITTRGDSRVRKLSNGQVTTVAGNGGQGFSGDGGSASCR